MALRKCPGCKNQIAVETLTCPICGCNPRTRRLRRIMFWTAASAATVVLIVAKVRQEPAGVQPVGSTAQAVAGVSR